MATVLLGITLMFIPKFIFIFDGYRQRQKMLWKECMISRNHPKSNSLKKIILI